MALVSKTDAQQTDYDSKTVASTYDLLTEFVPELVSGFDVESSSDKELTKKSLPYALFTIGQHKDMLNAYLYAQEKLSQIHRVGIANITAAQLAETIKHIHKLITNTLGADHGFEPGEIATHQVFRWHKSYDADDLIRAFFLRQITKENTIKGLVDFGYKEKTARSFLKILSRYVTGHHEVISGQFLLKLAADFHAKRLNRDELKIIKEVLIIHTPPSELPKLFDEFVANFLDRWKACDAKDPEQVVNLAYYVFYELTERHVFLNGNGRTATCLMNVVLRSLGQRSILVRTPSERDDPMSSYSQAIANIYTQPELLREHLKRRIYSDVPYEDPLLNNIMKHKLMMFDLLETCLTKYKFEQTNQFFILLQKFAVNHFLIMPETKNKRDIVTNPSIIRVFQEQIQGLRLFLIDPSAAIARYDAKSRPEPKPNSKTVAANMTLGFELERAKIAEKIKELTQETNVIFSKKDPFVIHINVANKERAGKLTEALNGTKALVAVSTSVKGDLSKSVVLLKEIKPELVMAIDKLQLPWLAEERVEGSDFQPGK